MTHRKLISTIEDYNADPERYWDKFYARNKDS